jgi:hypothetical protein
MDELTRSYITAYNPAAAERLVNQSACESALTRGTKNSSICCTERTLQTLRSDSTAYVRNARYNATLLLTSGSSTVARCCKGANSTCACGFPPTNSLKEPSSSARATSTSSSSSIVSPVVRGCKNMHTLEEWHEIVSSPLWSQY